MSIITDNENANLLAKACVNYYVAQGIDIVKEANILFTDDILNDQKKYIENINNNKKINGCFIPSSENIILIDFERLYELIVYPLITITHELTHMIDWNSFVKDFYNGQWDLAVKDTNFNQTFKCWSEYHATLKSLIDGRIINTYIESTYKLENIHKEFSNPEKPKSYYENIKNKKTVLLKDIFTYCSELYLCEQHMEHFNVEDYIPDNITRIFPSFSELYDDLKEMTTYKATKEYLQLLSFKLRNLNFVEVSD